MLAIAPSISFSRNGAPLVVSRSRITSALMNPCRFLSITYREATKAEPAKRGSKLDPPRALATHHLQLNAHQTHTVVFMH